MIGSADTRKSPVNSGTAEQKFFCQKTNRVGPQIRFTQQDRTGLRDSYRRAYNCYIDVSSIRPVRVFLGSCLPEHSLFGVDDGSVGNRRHRWTGGTPRAGSHDSDCHFLASDLKLERNNRSPGLLTASETTSPNVREQLKREVETCIPDRRTTNIVVTILVLVVVNAVLCTARRVFLHVHLQHTVRLQCDSGHNCSPIDTCSTPVSNPYFLPFCLLLP